MSGSFRAGLLANQASVGNDLRHTFDHLRDAGMNLTALFAPQHGFTGYTQANMIEVADDHDPQLNIPIYSLYGDVRKPTADMLKDIDLLFIDLQDVGVRGYTFAWTTLLAIEACAEHDVGVVIFDRPNPIGGVHLEGPLLREEYFSFVGMHSIPIRHGLTLGELATMMVREKGIDLQLQVVELQGWKGEHYFDEIGLPWIMPSPNLPTWLSTLVYPGMELLEGSNISEGRGTTLPFELFGAPFINADLLCKRMNDHTLAGVFFRPATFLPTFDKWQGELCQGAQIHVLDKQVFRSVDMVAYLLHTLFDMYGDKVHFLDPPYEYENTLPPIDILSGSAQFRSDILDGTDPKTIVQSWQHDLDNFEKRRQPFFMYER